jgi:hypothetical protein
MIIIGLIGHAGAGKDTVAQLLAERYRIARLAFADALRDEISQAFGVEWALLADPARKLERTQQLALRNCTEPGFCAWAWELQFLDEVSPRTLMQRWGDWRRAEDTDYFVKLARDKLARLTERSELDAVIVTDVRFHNEARLVRSVRGELWRITRPQGPTPNRHPSEWLLLEALVDAELANDGSLEQLAKKAADAFGEARRLRDLAA